MPRQIDPDETFDTLRDEMNFTASRLQDEAAAAGLAGRTTDWKSRIDAAEATARALDHDVTAVDAARQGANDALDAATTAFADALLPAVGKDRSSPRWRGFFRTSVSEFNRMPLAEQAAAVRGWLNDSQDAVLLAHKDALDAATGRVERAIARENALASRRGGLWQEREALASYLTNERDALHDELSAVARANGLPRGWASSFFRTRSGGKKAASPAPAPTPAAPPA